MHTNSCNTKRSNAHKNIKILRIIGNVAVLCILGSTDLSDFFLQSLRNRNYDTFHIEKKWENLHFFFQHKTVTVIFTTKTGN